MYNLTNLNTIKEIAAKFGFNFSKSLGQNFLTNPSVCPKIAELGGADQNTGIIEIGTGFGVLTKELAKLAKKVVAVEIDKSLLPVLNETLKSFDNIKIINEDILKVDLKQLIKEEFDGMNIAVCANLPYYITSPIIMSLLEQKLPIKSITVMVQKEVAQRLCAKMGTRGCSSITAAVNFYATPKLLFSVSRGSFFPPPNVDSAVIRLDIKKESGFNVKNEKHLFKLIRLSFSQRRKMLANPVGAGLAIQKAKLQEIMQSVGIKQSARAEELTLEQFVALSNAITENNNE